MYSWFRGRKHWNEKLLLFLISGCLSLPIHCETPNPQRNQTSQNYLNECSRHFWSNDTNLFFAFYYLFYLHVIWVGKTSSMVFLSSISQYNESVRTKESHLNIRFLWRSSSRTANPFKLRRSSSRSPNVCLSVCLSVTGQVEILKVTSFQNVPECSRMFQNV